MKIHFDLRIRIVVYMVTMAILITLIFCSSPLWAIEGYYKDILMDAGIGLSEATTLPAAGYLGLSMEFVALPGSSPTQQDYDIQNKVFIGDTFDDNGRLLYPDGQPRFRLVQVRGGSSFTHGASLREEGRQRFRDYVAGGGSYTGTCAGFSISSLCRSDFSPSPYPTYLHLWPAKCYFTGITPGTYLNHTIPVNSPLLNYYDFGGDNYIAGLYHNLGSYAIEGNPDYWCAGTEILMRHDNPGHHSDGNVSALAYKDSALSGRLTLIGSHPEGVTSGERRDLMSALLRYALDGNGLPQVKASLQNGVTRYMNDNLTPNHEKIGDQQYHHFIVEIPSGMTHLTITLDGDDIHDLDLFARYVDFAFRGVSGVIEAVNSSGSDEAITINNPAAGIWYIGVKGITTVTTNLESWGQDYTGNLEVLNGQTYTLTAAWDAPAGDLVVDGGINIKDLKVFFDHWLENALHPRVSYEWQGHWEFDASAGATASDASGQSRHGVVYNNPIWSPAGGRFNGALSFDEIDDYVKIPDFDYTNALHEFSLSFWFKINDVTGSGYQYMFSHADYSVNNSLNVYLRESGIATNPEHVSTSLELDDGTELWSVAPMALADGLWHLYTLTVSASTGAVIYIDAGPVDTRVDFKAGWYNPATDIYVGGRSNLNPDRYYGAPGADDGLLDDVRLYSFALSLEDIASVYAGTDVEFPQPQLICPVFPIGDLNEDGKVDLYDYTLIALNWAK